MHPSPTLPWFVLCVGLAFLLPRPVARAGINFTLRHEQVSPDAVPIEKTFVVDGAHKIYLNLPPGWQTSATPAALNLTSVTPAGATAQFDEGAGENAGKPPGYDEANRRLLREQALALLPAGAKDIVLQSEESNPVTLFGWTSHEVTYAYSFYGQSYLHSTMYLRMGSPRLLRVIVNAPRGSYPETYPAVRAALLSWFEQDLVLPEAGRFRGN